MTFTESHINRLKGHDAVLELAAKLREAAEKTAEEKHFEQLAEMEDYRKGNY